MPNHRHPGGTPDDGNVHAKHAFGAKMTAEPKPSGEKRNDATIASPILGDAVELVIALEPNTLPQEPEPKADVVPKQSRQYFGHATDPGYDLTQYKP